MPDALTATQREVRALAREFAEAEIAPHAAGWSERHEVPVDVLRGLADIGLMGVTTPEEYGGAGLDHTSLCLAIEAIAKADAGTSTAVAVQNGLASSPLLSRGSEEQKRRWLPALAAMDLIGAYALSEPEAGSDTASLRTTAAPTDDGGHVLNGTKQWISNGGIADFFIVFARTGGPGAKGISAFATEKGDGLVVGREIPKMGQHSSSTTELSFQEMHLPAGSLLGEEGTGLETALSTLDGGRIVVAAQACGIASAALDAASDYARTRIAFGGPIGRFQGVSFPLAEMSARLDAARLLMLHAAGRQDAGEPHSIEGAKAKLVASRVAVEAADVAVQTLGGYGYSAEFPVERYYRDAKVTEIYEGTSQIQRLVIARAMLGRL